MGSGCGWLGTGHRLRLLALAALGLALLGSAAADEPGTAQRGILLPIRASLAGSGLSGDLPQSQAESMARDNLVAGTRAAFAARAGLALSELPALTPEEQASLEEHLALIDLIVRPRVLNGAGILTTVPRFNAIESRDAEPPFGTGLAFLAERTGTDVGIYVEGFQQPMEPTLSSLGYGGALPYLIQATTSGTSARVAVLDFRAGVIRWTNAQLAVNPLGFKRKDLLAPDKVNALMAGLLADYPRVTVTRMFPFAAQVPAHRVGPESKHFSVQLPAGWSYEASFSTLKASRDGVALNWIALVARTHRVVFKAAKRRSGPDVSPLELASAYVENLKADNPQLRDVSVVASETAEVAQRPAFRVRLRYRLPANVTDVAMDELTVGVANQDVLVLASFRAPSICYFESQRAEFERTVASISFEPPPPPSRR